MVRPLPDGPICSIPFPSHVCLLAKTFPTSPPLNPLTPAIHPPHPIYYNAHTHSPRLVAWLRFFLRPPASSISSKEVYRMFHNYSQDSLEFTQPEMCFGHPRSFSLLPGVGGSTSSPCRWSVSLSKIQDIFLDVIPCHRLTSKKDFCPLASVPVRGMHDLWLAGKECVNIVFHCLLLCSITRYNWM